MAPLMYGISVLSCMSSALSEADGAGLGMHDTHAQFGDERADATLAEELQVVRQYLAIEQLRLLGQHRCRTGDMPRGIRPTLLDHRQQLMTDKIAIKMQRIVARIVQPAQLPVRCYRLKL